MAKSKAFQDSGGFGQEDGFRGDKTRVEILSMFLRRIYPLLK